MGKDTQDVETAQLIDSLREEIKWMRGALAVASHHCEIRKCQACGHAYSKGWTRPCGHYEDSASLSGVSHE